MKFSYTVELDTTKDSSNTIGEFLRGKFWDQSGGKYGCYSTFDTNNDVKILPSEPNEYCEGTPWKCLEWNGIICRYYWDGDGTIQFILPDGIILENNDCKKDYCWEW